VRQAPRRVVDEEQPTARGLHQDHPDWHLPEDRFEAILGLPAQLGDLPESSLAFSDPPLCLDPRRDLVEGADRDAPSIGQDGLDGVQEGPALGSSGEPEADQHRLRRLAEHGAASGKVRWIERLARFVEELEPADAIGRVGLHHRVRAAVSGQPGRHVVDVEEPARLVLDADPGAHAGEDGRQVDRGELGGAGRGRLRVRHGRSRRHADAPDRGRVRQRRDCAGFSQVGAHARLGVTDGGPSVDVQLTASSESLDARAGRPSQ
jgi:hypothetical protein